MAHPSSSLILLEPLLKERADQPVEKAKQTAISYSYVGAGSVHERMETHTHTHLPEDHTLLYTNTVIHLYVKCVTIHQQAVWYLLMNLQDTFLAMMAIVTLTS